MGRKAQLLAEMMGGGEAPSEDDVKALAKHVAVDIENDAERAVWGAVARYGDGLPKSMTGKAVYTALKGAGLMPNTKKIEDHIAKMMRRYYKM